MKISFTAYFFWIDTQRIIPELELNDAFLFFLPKKLAIVKSKRVNSYSRYDYFNVSMETEEFFSIERMKDILDGLNISIRNIQDIKREFTDEELKKLKTSVTYKKIFQKPKKG